MKRSTRITAAAAGVALLGGVGLTAATAAPVGFTSDRSADLAKQINPAKPRNVILIIGDGTDDSMITAARNYELGAAGRYAIDELPFTGEMTTYGLSVAPSAPYPLNYVSDSAPTASAWSTGKKTVDGRISQGPSASNTIPGDNYETVLETYKKQGKRTGNVSTAEITDATPAAAASHINARACQGPADLATCPSALKSAGGLGSISEQLVDNKIDVILGGGKQRYDQTLPGTATTALSYAQTTHGYRYVGTRTDLAGITSLAGGPVLGLFTAGNMTPKYQPLTATAVGNVATPATCVAADRGTEPTLAEMTSKAISLLDNPNGFFLQVESAMVDKQEHAADICGAIGDISEMDNALKVAQTYQAAHPDTLIIVTGDHGHSTQIVPNSAGSGRQTTTLTTKDGYPMTVAYSTAIVPGSQSHTGTQIRVAASGPQAANVTGTIDQTDLYATLLGRTPSTLPGTGGTTPPTTGTPVRLPQVVVGATPKRQGKKLKVKVQSAATDATSVTLRLLRNGKTLDTATLGATGGKSTLRTRKTTGKLRVVATAVGAGGAASSSVKIKR